MRAPRLQLLPWSQQIARRPAMGKLPAQLRAAEMQACKVQIRGRFLPFPECAESDARYLPARCATPVPASAASPARSWEGCHRAAACRPPAPPRRDPGSAPTAPAADVPRRSLRDRRYWLHPPVRQKSFPYSAASATAAIHCPSFPKSPSVIPLAIIRLPPSDCPAGPVRWHRKIFLPAWP